jgi:hypothetical protein
LLHHRLQSLLKSCGCFENTYEDLTFGPRSIERIPYGDIASMWDSRRQMMLPCCMCCCYPTTLLYRVLTAPCWIPVSLYQWCTQADDDDEQTKAFVTEESRRIRPAVGTV